MPTPRQLVRICRIFKTDNAPPFIYVASNLGKQIGFAGFSLCLFKQVEVTKTKIQPSIDIATKAFLD